MPLRRGEPVSEAIHELTHYGSRPRSHEQIVAIALSNHDRRPKRGMGGGIAMGMPGLNQNTIDHQTPIASPAPNAVMPTNISTPAPVPPPGAVVPNNVMPGTPFSGPSFGFGNRFGSGSAFGAGNPVMNRAAPPVGSINPSTVYTQPMPTNVAQPTPPPMRRGGIAHLATGGFQTDPNFERMEARAIGGESQYHPGGFISSDVAGRTDRLPLSVAADSFVMPADVVSGLGQGNSLAGAKMLDAITSSPAPYGVRQTGGHRGSGPPRPPRSTGGAAGKSDVILAGGEYSVTPEKLTAIGARRRKAGMSKAHTDLAAGHEWAREFVDRIRKHQRKFLASAPKPKR